MTTVPRLSDWTKVDRKPGGANPGAIYVAPCGTRYYVKGSFRRVNGDSPADVEDIRARCEVLTARLLTLADVAVPETTLIDLGNEYGGGLGIASKAIDGRVLDIAYRQDADLLTEHLAAIVWLGHTDVICQGNTFVADNRAVCVDVGNALMFESFGGLIYPDGRMSSVPTEWRSMRSGLTRQMIDHPSTDPRIDLKALVHQEIFGQMDREALSKSVSRVANVPESAILRAVMDYGPTDTDMQLNLTLSLMARRAWMMSAVN